MLIDFESYLADAKLKEEAVAGVFLRLDKNAESRVTRAVRQDRRLSQHLSTVPLNVASYEPDESSRPAAEGKTSSPGKGGQFWLVGPELAGMMEEACYIAETLLERGCRVNLLTRAFSGDEELVLKDAPEPPASLLARYGDSFRIVPVKPLEGYTRRLPPKPGTVISFFPPLSPALTLAGVPHFLVVKDLEDALSSKTLSRDETERLVFLPDYVLLIAPQQGSPRHDGPVQTQLSLEARYPSGETPRPEGAAVSRQTRRAAFPFSPSLLLFLSNGRPLPVPPPPQVPDVSACIIAKDEEGMIEDCLLSLVPVADETVVNDTGSRDGTARVARALGATVFSGGWEDDFSKARNACIERASCMYVFSIDADERVTPESKPVFKRSLLPKEGIYPHALLVSVKNILGEGVEKDCQLLRVHLNRPSYRYSGRVHEQIFPSIKGPIVTSPITLEHLGYGSLVSRSKDKRRRNILLVGEALESGENRAYYQFQLGVEMKNTGNFAEAIPLLQSAFKSLHAASHAMFFAALALVESYASLGKVDEILAFWNEVKREFPGLLELAETIAEVLIGAGRAGEARTLLEEAAKFPPPSWLAETDGVRTFTLDLLLARSYLGSDDKERALFHITRSLNSNPDHPPAQRLLVRVWPDKALQMLKEAGASKARAAVVESLQMGAWESALRLAQEFAGTDPGALGEVYLARREFAEASRWFLRSGEKWDKTRGEILKLVSDSAPAAVVSDETVRDIFTGRPAPRGRIPGLLRALGFLVDIGAFELFEKGLRALSSCDDPEFFAGQLLFEKGFLDLAADFLVTSLKRGKRPETLAMLGQIAWNRGLYQECAALYQELESFRPLTRQESLKAVSALANLGRVEDAWRLLQKSVGLYGPDEAFEKVAGILRRMREITQVTGRETNA
ncbi:MAG TPA: glycosyltransferase [Firmicutes bacterium]|nr:glycosyltransferase [Candidatus Fermentithermobacillaceae bacterium]